MLDQLRRDIKTRLDELLSEADKLRRALAALRSRESPTPRSASTTSSRAAADHSPQPTRPPATTPLAPKASATKPSATKPAAKRTAQGGTKSAVVAALADGNAMTAGEIATATGLGRATVSTTLSRLAKTGEVTKAARGYLLTDKNRTPAGA